MTSRFTPLWLSLLILVLLLPGCARLGKKTVQPDALEVRLTLKGVDGGTSPTMAVYRPGEMVTATVEITNRLKEPVTLLTPYASDLTIDSNISFLFKVKDSEGALRRVPVHPKRPPAHINKEVAPDAGTSRTFSFVNLTRNPGVYLLTAQYVAPLAAASSDANSQFFSKPVQFEVKGPVLWHRDADGMLLKEDAVQVAAKFYGRPVVSSHAELVENEMGLKDWWVTLRRAPADIRPGEGPLLAFFVSPYGAFVASNRQAKPFEPKGQPQSKAAAPAAANPGSTAAPAPAGAPAAPKP